jgi:undecaprenyl phosphate-alpha-L-ara4N flippase subunit ArnE
VKQAVLLYAIAGAVLAAFGQVCFKQGAAGRELIADFFNVWIFGGLALYGAGTMLWIVALSDAPLTAVYPFAALTYVLVNVLAYTLLGERLPLQAVLGTGFVLFGLFLVATSLEVSHAAR